MKYRSLTYAIPTLFALSATTALPVHADVLSADLSGFDEVPTLSLQVPIFARESTKTKRRFNTN